MSYGSPVSNLDYTRSQWRWRDCSTFSKLSWSFNVFCERIGPKKLHLRLGRFILIDIVYKLSILALDNANHKVHFRNFAQVMLLELLSTSVNKRTRKFNYRTVIGCALETPYSHISYRDTFFLAF